MRGQIHTAYFLEQTFAVEWSPSASHEGFEGKRTRTAGPATARGAEAVRQPAAPARCGERRSLRPSPPRLGDLLRRGGAAGRWPAAWSRCRLPPRTRSGGYCLRSAVGEVVLVIATSTQSASHLPLRLDLRQVATSTHSAWS